MSSLKFVGLNRYWMEGQGVSRQKIKSLEKHAKRGNADAQYKLAVIYNDGINPDMVKVTELLEKSAEQGHSDSCLCLGVNHLSGTVVKKDSKKSVYYFRIAAAKRVPEALFRLGECYHAGVGVRTKLYRALSLYQQAIDTGFTEFIMACGSGTEKRTVTEFIVEVLRRMKCCCGFRGTSKCSVCHRTYYCSRKCQIDDWVIHKKRCIEFISEEEETDDSYENTKDEV